MKERSFLFGLLAVVMLLVACSAYQGYRKAQIAEKQGDWDQAVLHYLELVDRYPNKVTYRTGLLRSKIRASQGHFEKGKKFQEAGALERAFAEYQQAVQLDPTNQYAQVELDKLREQLLRSEGERSVYADLQEMKERNRGARPQPPILSPRSDESISLEFPKPVSVFDIYRSLGKAFGINILFDPKLRDQQIAIELRDVVAQDALEILMRTANHFYKVLDEHSIIVVEDNPQNRRNYEDLVIQTFFLSNAEVKSVMTMLRSLVGAKNIASNDQLNAIVLRDTADKVKVAERIISTNDKSRGEVVIDVELLQINSNKVRDLGVSLSQNFVVQSLNAPADPDAPSGSIRVSELEFIDQGDWFITIPNIVYTFIKNSTDAELLASPQIRISDGEQATLHIGDRVPIPVTSFNTSSTVGTNIVPITSFQYQDIGIRLDLEPRIHHNKEISLKLQVEVSDLSGFVEGTAGQQQPIIGTRTIESTIRLMNGETNFLAGLIRTGAQRNEEGIPGLSDIPVLGRLFSRKRTEKTRTDLVLTLTPHIIRTPDITEEDLLPIWVGTEANITFRGGSPRVESEVEGPFDEGADSDAERIREMIRRRIQNLPRGLQGTDAEEKEEEEPTPGVDLVPSAPPGDVFRPPGGNQDSDEDEPRSLIIVPGSDEGESSAALDLFVSAEESSEQQGERPTVRLQLLPGQLKVEESSSFEIRIVAEAISPVSHLPITLEYDESFLSVEAVEAGGFLGPPGDAEVLYNHSQAGQIIIGASRLGDQEGVTGRGTVAKVRFRAELEGASSVRFARSRALDADLEALGPLLTDEAQVEVVSQGEGNEGAATDGSDRGS
jgi:general secretion pathway protein D